MMDSPTLILEDDERTVVSPPPLLWADSSPPPGASASIRQHAPKVALAAIVAATIGALVGWLVHERAIAAQLREKLIRIEAPSAVVGTPPDAGAWFTPTKEAVDGEPVASLLVVGEHDDRIRRGAELLVENRFREALSYYRQLADEAPEQEVFRDIVQVVEAKLGCHHAGGAGSGQCE